MKYSFGILKNKNLFKRHKYPSSNALIIRYFWTLSYNHWGFLSIFKLSNPYFQKKGMPRKHLDAALTMAMNSSVMPPDLMRDQVGSYAHLQI